MKLQNTFQNRIRQRGAALIVALLMLLVMTVLGVAAMGVTRMEERMAGNTRDIDVAFQAAEAGLRDSEERIRALILRPNPTSTIPSAIYTQDLWKTVNLKTANFTTWWTPNAIEYGTASVREITDSTRDPRVLTEDMGFVPDSLTVGHGPPEGRNFYKITSNAAGATDDANAILESTYTRRY
jgi:type IV pilus assembly protein PilX